MGFFIGFLLVFAGHCCVISAIQTLSGSFQLNHEYVVKAVSFLPSLPVAFEPQINSFGRQR